MSIRSIVLGLILLAHASSASAIVVYLGSPSTTGPLDPGEQFSIPLLIDTEGTTDLTGIFVSVAVDPDLLTFVGGVSPNFILYNSATFDVIAKVTDPFLLNGDASGVVRAAGYNTVAPNGPAVSSTGELIATLTFEAVDGLGGTATVTPFLALGDQIERSNLDASNQVSFESSAGIAVNLPEPAVGLQLGIGALGLCLMSNHRRRERSSPGSRRSAS